MDKKSRILLIIAAVALILSVGVTFWRIVIARDYPISLETACDPASEKCFIKTCTPDDPANNPCSDEKATTEYYKTLQMEAHSIPACDESNGNCAQLSCVGQMADAACTETLCDESAKLPDGVTCNDPATYQPPGEKTDNWQETPAEDAPATDQESTDTTTDSNAAPADSATLPDTSATTPAATPAPAQQQ